MALPGITTPAQRAETEAPPKPTEAPPKPAAPPDEDEDLRERRRRIIREIPDPTPQPGGQ